MNVFEAVKESVTTRYAAESYGIQVRHNGMCCCPFHGDKTPSMKVDKRFHCFGCGEDGDVIDFAAKLFNLSRRDAALKLADDFGIIYDRWKPDRKSNIKPPERKKSSEQIYRETEHSFYMTLANYREMLLDWKQTYTPKTIEEKWDDRFAEALYQLSRVEAIMDEFLVASKKERKEMFIYFGKTVEKYDKRLKENKTEEKEESVMETLQGSRDRMYSAGERQMCM